MKKKKKRRAEKQNRMMTPNTFIATSQKSTCFTHYLFIPSGQERTQSSLEAMAAAATVGVAGKGAQAAAAAAAAASIQREFFLYRYKKGC